jgi:citrate synthase
MSRLKEKLAKKIPAYRERVTRLVKEHGDVVIDQVHVRQMYGGMRGLKSLTTDISYLDPEEGIRFRTISRTLLMILKPEAPFLNMFLICFVQCQKIRIQ